MQPKRMDQRRRRTAARPRAHLVERFQRCGLTLKWQRAGFFLALWRAGLAEYDEMEGIAWDWQSVDGAMAKAPLAVECVGANPTDRGKKWAQTKFVSRRAWRPAVARRERSQRA